MRLLVVILILLTVVALAQPVRRGQPAPGYLALGDSYTIGESVGSDERYPVQAMQGSGIAGVPDIIATTGWTTGDLLQALARKKRATGYRVVSLLIGVNNQYQGRSRDEYRDQFSSLLKAAIALAGDRPGHVIVLSIPDYSVTPFARARGLDTALIAAQIDSFNLVNHLLALQYGVNYLDVTGESRKAVGDASLLAADGLHFSGKEYAIWAQMMVPVIKRITTSSQK